MSEPTFEILSIVIDKRITKNQILKNIFLQGLTYIINNDDKFDYASFGQFIAATRLRQLFVGQSS